MDEINYPLPMTVGLTTRRVFLQSAGLAVIGLGLAGCGVAPAGDMLVCRRCKSVVRGLVGFESGRRLEHFCPACGCEWRARSVRNSGWIARYAVSSRQKRNRARYLFEKIGVGFPNPDLVAKTVKPLASFRNFTF